MDAKYPQYQHQYGTSQPPHDLDAPVQNPRFSWQMLAEDSTPQTHSSSTVDAPGPRLHAVNQNQPNRQNYQRANSQPDNPLSWAVSPAEMQEPQTVYPPIHHQQRQPSQLSAPLIQEDSRVTPHYTQAPQAQHQVQSAQPKHQSQTPQTAYRAQHPMRPEHSYPTVPPLQSYHQPPLGQLPQQLSQVQTWHSSVSNTVPHPASPLPQKDAPSSPTEAPHSPGPIPMKSERDANGNSIYIPHSPVQTSFQRQSTVPFSPDSLFAADVPPAAALHHAPGQVVHPNMNMGTPGKAQDWEHEVCDCNGDFGTCLMGICCPCVLHGKTSYRLAARSDKRDPTDLLGWKKVNNSCVLMSVACGLWCLFPLVSRTRIRHSYNLAGSLGSDILNACCCCCCVVVQNEREVRDREDKAQRFKGPVAQVGYSRTDTMTYAGSGM